jgi:hypothetical protein
VSCEDSTQRTYECLAAECVANISIVMRYAKFEFYVSKLIVTIDHAHSEPESINVFAVGTLVPR